MLIWTARFSRKKAVWIILGVGAVMAALIMMAGRSSGQDPQALPQLLTNEDRVAYLETLGWEVETEPVETLRFLMPEELVEPYLTYNQLQLSQGFDLAACCGKQVARYTYTITNYPDRPTGVQANLYVCEDLPAAGDVCCPGNNGFQEALVQQDTGE